MSEAAVASPPWAGVDQDFGFTPLALGFSFKIPEVTLIPLPVPKAVESYPLWGAVRGSEGEIILSKPISVSIVRSGDNFFAQNDFFSLSGVGQTKEEAVADFIEFLVHDYSVLNSSKDDELTLGAKALLKEYRKVVSQ